MSNVTAVTSEDEPVPIAARRADVLANVAETYVSNNVSSGSTADRYQVVVHVGEDPLGDSAHLEDGPHVTAETSRRIACDSSLTAKWYAGERMDWGLAVGSLFSQ